LGIFSDEFFVDNLCFGSYNPLCVRFSKKINKKLGAFPMPKPKRGKLAHTIKSWRGTCPACNRTGVKLLWEKTEGDKPIKVCKQCGASS